MLKIVAILFAFLISIQVSCIQNSPPIIKGQDIVFDNGQAISFIEKKILFNNPKDALEAGKPVSVSERPLLIKEWKRLIFFREKFYYEGAETNLSIYDYSGHLIGPTRTFTGKAYFLKNVKRILLAQISSHMRVDQSLLLDSNGKIIEKIKHGEIFDVDISEDEQLLWFHANDLEDSKPVARVMIFNNDGKKIDEKRLSQAGKIKIKYKGKDYDIKVKEPDYPG
jgi:hypothetical protein